MPVYETIYNFNKRQLEAELEERNDGLKNYVWDVEHIYDLTKDKDRQEYIKYCIDCFYDKDCRDGHSKLMGAKFSAESGQIYRAGSGSDQDAPNK